MPFRPRHGRFTWPTGFCGRSNATPCRFRGLRPRSRALWTIVPALLQRNLQLDAIEGVAYGRDWQLGYWKHPPLPWLLMDLTHRIFGPRLWPFFLLGQLASAVAFWATWRLGRELFTPLEAFVAVVILDGNIEYSFNTTGVQSPHPGIAVLRIGRLVALSGFRWQRASRLAAGRRSGSRWRFTRNTRPSCCSCPLSPSPSSIRRRGGAGENRVPTSRPPWRRRFARRSCVDGARRSFWPYQVRRRQSPVRTVPA